MRIIYFSLLFSLFLACSGQQKEIKLEGKTMGTYYRVTTYGTDSPADLKVKVDKFLGFFNDIFSTYIPTSEISRINTSKFDNMKMSDSFHKLMALSLDISKKSYGYFDVTVAPLVNAWGFGPEGRLSKPTKDKITAMLAKVGYDKLKMVDNRLHKPIGMQIDMSAVAKGHGVDELVKFLEFRGFKNLLVEIGGEVRTRGKKADGSSWRVGIEGPAMSLGSKIAKVVPLNEMSMATSGSYRNFIKYGDEVFNHTIDPKTGYPIKHKTISVSVLHEYCTDADAWATALMSMGAQKGIDLANKNNIKAYFQVKEDQGIKTYSTKDFDKYMSKNK